MPPPTMPTSIPTSIPAPARPADPAAPDVATAYGVGAGGAAIGIVAVIGLGLIGGSVARDLAALGIRVLGHDRDAGTVREAVGAGVVHAAMGDGLEGIGEADVVIVATPVDEAPRVLAAVAAAGTRARLVTDVGSTKRSIGEAAAAQGMGARFVGAHPLAGDHRCGWRASRRDMFRGARVYLCPAAGCDGDATTLACSLWELLGAVPELRDAADHDALLAWSSHLPQLTATALALALHESGVDRAQLGRGGMDMTRLAGSSPEMWTAITRDNPAAIAAAIETLERQLGELRAALRDGDRTRLLARFQAGREWFEAHQPIAATGG